ncbi:MAG: C2HC-type zinc finger protein [Fluviibacter sp.]
MDRGRGPAPAAPGDGGAAAINNALIQHDRVRRTTDIPLFHGMPNKDSISPQQLIDRLERAARVAHWNTDELKCDQFFLSLRDEALKWSYTLDNIIGFNKENWGQVKGKFLEAYAPKFSAKALCISFQDLKQRAQEDVQTFYNRVSETFRNAYSTKPDHVTTYDGDVHGLPQATCNTIMGQGLKRMELLMMNTVFTGGLREDIRAKVLEEGPTQIEESVKLAREIETILEKKRDRSVFVTSIGEEESPEVLEIEEDELEHLNAVNMIRKRRGLPAMRFKVRRPQGGKSSGQKFSGNCYNCGKFGHRANHCRAPKKAIGKVNEIRSQGDETAEHEHLNF